MISGNANTPSFSQFRQQLPPEQTAARELYLLDVAQEFRLAHRVTWAANKPSEVNAFNMAYSPSMIVPQFPSQKHGLQTFRIMSYPIKLLGLSGGG